jgi:xanthine/uracil permease
MSLSLLSSAIFAHLFVCSIATLIFFLSLLTQAFQSFRLPLPVGVLFLAHRRVLASLSQAKQIGLFPFLRMLLNLMHPSS